MIIDNDDKMQDRQELLIRLNELLLLRDKLRNQLESTESEINVVLSSLGVEWA